MGGVFFVVYSENIRIEAWVSSGSAISRQAHNVEFKPNFYFTLAGKRLEEYLLSRTRHILFSSPLEKLPPGPLPSAPLGASCLPACSRPQLRPQASLHSCPGSSPSFCPTSVLNTLFLAFCIGLLFCFNKSHASVASWERGVFPSVWKSKNIFILLSYLIDSMIGYMSSENSFY